jgi:hypothetical protein
MAETIKVQNCIASMGFDVDIKNPFFPIRGSGVVSQTYCGKCTNGDEYAGLVTDDKRTFLFCRTLFCEKRVSDQT